MFQPEVLNPTVEFLKELAGHGAALEFGTGTGRVALSELDLMARLAGMTLSERWAGWNREPFTDESHSHVSV
jgi:hypothetical protein